MEEGAWSEARRSATNLPSYTFFIPISFDEAKVALWLEQQNTPASVKASGILLRLLMLPSGDLDEQVDGAIGLGAGYVARKAVKSLNSKAARRSGLVSDRDRPLSRFGTSKEQSKPRHGTRPYQITSAIRQQRLLIGHALSRRAAQYGVDEDLRG